MKRYAHRAMSSNVITTADKIFSSNTKKCKISSSARTPSSLRNITRLTKIAKSGFARNRALTQSLLWEYHGVSFSWGKSKSTKQQQKYEADHIGPTYLRYGPAWLIWWIVFQTV